MNSREVAVWDPMVRLFHWLLVGTVVGAVVGVKIGGEAMTWHGRFGVAVVGLLAFRLVWGMIGPPTARFSQFVRGPAAVAAYLRGEWRGVGHNPLGGWSVVAMISLLALLAGLGLFATDEIAYRGPLAHWVAERTQVWAASWHRRLEPLLWLLVGLHVGAILFYRFARGIDLVTPMITGFGVAPETSGGGGIEWGNRSYWQRAGAAVAAGAAAAFAASGLWGSPPSLTPPATMEW
ncbi:MAG: cytochrome b/b6 domain-containing protein [Hydrogenophilus sp.]|nr:cytochrome b/b6 domain-containing protein [Hydrogenophilus sp.]